MKRKKRPWPWTFHRNINIRVRFRRREYKGYGAGYCASQPRVPGLKARKLLAFLCSSMWFAAGYLRRPDPSASRRSSRTCFLCNRGFCYIGLLFGGVFLPKRPPGDYIVVSWAGRAYTTTPQNRQIIKFCRFQILFRVCFTSIPKMDRGWVLSLSLFLTMGSVVKALEAF